MESCSHKHCVNICLEIIKEWRKRCGQTLKRERRGDTLEA